MAAPRWSFVFVLATLGCVPAPRLASDVPDDVAWAAVVTLDHAGAIEASPLTPWPRGEGLTVAATQRGDTFVLGYTAAQIAALAAEVPPGARLTRAKGCDVPLPAPRWSGRWSADRLTPAEASAVPPLTAEWLLDACPELDARPLAVDASCAETRCAREPTWTSRCRFELDLEACASAGRFAARVGPNGSLCLEPLDTAWSCAPEDEALACTTPEATPCRLHAELGPWPQPFDLTEVPLVPGAPPFLPEWLRRLGQLRPGAHRTGIAVDMAAVGDTLVVALPRAGAPHERCDPRAPAGSLVFVDLETAASRSVTAPPCIHAVAPLPGGFAAAFAEGSSLALGRFDAAGRLLHHVLTVHEALPRRLGAGRDQATALLFAEGRLLALWGGGDARAILTAHHPETLALERTLDLGTAHHWTLRPGLRPGELLLLDSRARAVRWLDLEAWSIVHDEPIPWRPSPRESDGLFDLVVDHQRMEILVAGSLHPALHTLGDRAPHRVRAIHPSATLHPLSLSALEAPLFFAGGTAQREDGAWRATGSLYDAAAGRFLPGSFDLGHGITGPVHRDPTGRLWVLLPWTGALLRLDPR